jgi:hypothetical protein
MSDLSKRVAKLEAATNPKPRMKITVRLSDDPSNPDAEQIHIQLRWPEDEGEDDGTF